MNADGNGKLIFDPNLCNRNHGPYAYDTPALSSKCGLGSMSSPPTYSYDNKNNSMRIHAVYSVILPTTPSAAESGQKCASEDESGRFHADTDGVRKMPVCIDGKVFWWDRRQEDTITAHPGGTEFVRGYCSDGELVADTTFVVFDCYAITGTTSASACCRYA